MVRAALRLTVAAAACATMSLSCVWPAEYQPDAGPNPPPYIKWDSANPPFVPELTLPLYSRTDFTITAGDADPEKTLTVRLCGRSDANPGTTYVKVSTDNPVTPTRDHTADRLPLTIKNIDVCSFFLNDTKATHYLYVFVSDGGFDPGGCDVTAGAQYSQAAWTVTCTDVTPS